MSIPKCAACGNPISTENELKEGFCADCLWAFSEDANWDNHYKKVETDDHDQFVSDMQEEPDDRSDEF